MTPWQLFVNDFKDGCGTDHCSKANKVVLARGSVPADVVFVGEAPGESEDALGLPFVGPAGKLQDRIVKKALAGSMVCHECRSTCFTGLTSICCEKCASSMMPTRTAFCNLVGCIPRDENGKKVNEPEHEQIVSCTPRLEKFIALCQPRLLVCVGKLSGDWLKQGFKLSVKVPASTKIVNVIHPAAILRANVVQQSLLEQKAVVTLRTAFAELEN